MGYKVNRTIYKLKFADPKYEGLEVRVKSPAMGIFFDVSALAGLDVNMKSVSPDQVEKVNQLFKHFTDSVLDWNLEDDDGEPIPHTVDGLKTLDLDFVMDMIQAWISALQGINPNLAKPSDNGQEFPEALIPMEELLPSHRS